MNLARCFIRTSSYFHLERYRSLIISTVITNKFLQSSTDTDFMNHRASIFSRRMDVSSVHLKSFVNLLAMASTLRQPIFRSGCGLWKTIPRAPFANLTASPPRPPIFLPLREKHKTLLSPPEILVQSLSNPRKLHVAPLRLRMWSVEDNALLLLLVIE